MPTWAKQQYENNGFSISKSEVMGYSFAHLTGYNPDIDSGADETVWPYGGLYPWSKFDSNSYTLSVVSTSASDTGSVVVDGLDASFNAITEEIDLDGLTPSSGTLEFKRVNSVRYKNGTAANLGNISISADGVVVAYIAVGFGVSLLGIYTVPANKTGFITTGDFSVQKGEDAQVRFYTRPFGENFRIGHMAESYQNTYRYDFPLPLPIPEKSDLEVRCSLVETNNTRVTCNFDIVLVDNTKLRR